MDEQFNKPLFNLFYYSRLNNDLEKDVGDFLRSKTQRPKDYSNDIRHQYVSAMYARNKGEDITKLLGSLHEILNLSEGEVNNKKDKAIDLYNNNIGIQYGKRYPDVSKQQLLDLLFNDYETNRRNRNNKLGF